MSELPTSPTDGEACRRRRRCRLAALAFVLHAPGVVILGRHRVATPVLRENVWYLGITLAAMATAGALAPSTWRVAAIVAAWAVGHFAWSIRLAFAMWRA